jgi:hypothetical protein
VCQGIEVGAVLVVAAMVSVVAAIVIVVVWVVGRRRAPWWPAACVWHCFCPSQDKSHAGKDVSSLLSSSYNLSTSFVAADASSEVIKKFRRDQVRLM